MARKKAPVEDRVKKAAKLLLECPKLSVAKAMLAERFTPEEADNPSLQMKVRRYLKEISNVPVVVDGNGNRPVSPLTSPSVAASSKASSSTTSSKAAKAIKLAKKAGAKQIRRTSNQAQQARVNQRKVKELQKKAFKEATSIYAVEKPKNAGKSAKDVCNIVNERYGTSVSERTVQKYVKLGKVGESPMSMGPDGGVPKDVFKLLGGALESFVRINQANTSDSIENTRKNLCSRVNAVVNSVLGDEVRKGDRLLNRLLADSGIDINAKVDVGVEERRIRWTTYANLRLWFETWKIELVELGFASRNGGDYKIADEQLERILNLDESCLAMDGSTGRRGGRPTATFFDPNIPRVGKATTKSSMTTTFITGSTAAGEALPPHFQFSTKATSTDREKIKRETLFYFQSTKGKFGNSEVKRWPTTVGLNNKGGMDDEEFEKYLLNSIVPLYPDAVDKSGKRVLIKIDSGPGRCNLELLARLRNLGFILYPGVPNTTSVTQETDQSYGLFKHHFRKNLDLLTRYRIEEQKTVNIQPSLVGLLVFGGIDPETRLGGFKNAFAIAFTKEKNKEAWMKVGAAPLTMACLSSNKVRHEAGVRGDPLAETYRNMQVRNDTCCFLLKQKGYDSGLLKVKLAPRRMQETAVTAPHTQERVEALAKAIYHGEKFHVTGGTHYTHDDVLKAGEIEAKELALKRMEADKKDRLNKETIEQEAFEILEKEIEIAKLTSDQLKKLLFWYGITKKDIGKMKVKDMRDRFITIKQNNTAPIKYRKWNLTDEINLENLRKKEISLADTALGRLRETKKREMEASFKAMSPESQENYIKRLKTLRGGAVVVNEDDI